MPVILTKQKIINQTICQYIEQAKILASDAQANDQFGRSVSLSGDGNTAIVGAYFEDTGGSEAGAAYIYTRMGVTWSEQQKIQASDKESGDRFGQSVSISNDGNTAIVGAYREGTWESIPGAAYIFTRSGSTWSQQAKIQASDGEDSDNFGWSVSISSDGNTAIIGANQKYIGASNVGAAYIFTRSGSTWSQQAKIQASDAQGNDRFGTSISISNDGNTAIVGAFGKDSGALNAGAAYIFIRSGSVWSQQAKIQASDLGEDNEFGFAVALSGDGNTAIVGAYLHDHGETFNYFGSSYVFTRIGTIWTEQQELFASSVTSGAQFGYSVGISYNGHVIVIGAINDNNSGSSFIFKKNGNVWIECNKIISNDLQNGDSFSESLAISNNGSTLIIAAPLEDDGGSQAGAVYIFTE